MELAKPSLESLVTPKGMTWPGMVSQAARSFFMSPQESIEWMLQEDSTSKQLAKFILVGVLNTSVSYLVYFFLVDYIDYLIALAISHLVGVTHSYIWNKYWTFKSHRRLLSEFIRFNSVYAVVFVINAIILTVFVSTLHINSRLGQLITLPIVTIISFTGHRRWSFKDR